MSSGSLYPGQRIQEFFAAIAGRYDLVNRLGSFWCDVWWRRWVAKEVGKLAPQRILDLATGSGDLALALRRTCPQALVVGADFCAPMLELARRKGVENLVVADGMVMPFADASFDVVTIAFGLRNMESWPAALKECARVLRPGGQLVVLDFSLPVKALRWAYRIYLHHVLPTLAGVITGQRQIYTYLADSIEEFPTGQAMAELMGAAGLTMVKQVPLQFGIVTAHFSRR